jgi:hypothetical protein
LNNEYCGYKIHVYPSADTEAQFVNGQALLFTLIVVGVFIFTSLVFVIYDCIVARRQRIVMDRAVASSAIVASLFPSQVRNQIYQESKEQQQLAKEEGQVKATTDTWKVFQAPKDDDISGEIFKHSINVGINSSSSKPIANLFHNTTIMFADLAGFTKWSSDRTPEQVFELLETIYAALDKIADRRKVFKIETIGDCYVAVVRI